MDFTTWTWVLLGIIWTLTFLIQSYISDKLKISPIILYLILGIFLSFSGIHVNSQLLYYISPVFDLLLGLVALFIGLSLTTQILKNHTMSSLIITLCCMIITFITVSVGVYQLTGLPIYTSVLLGSIATVISPISSIFVFKENRSVGNTTEQLYKIFTFNALLSFILISLIIPFVKFMLQPHNKIDFLAIGTTTLLSVVLSIVFGFLLGVLFSFITKLTKKTVPLFMIIIAYLCLCIGIAGFFHFSYFLTIVTLGITIRFFAYDEIPEQIDEELSGLFHLLTPLFFIAIGSYFHFQYFISTIGIGCIYLVFRYIGQYTGAYVGVLINKKNNTHPQLLGLSLFSQAGILSGTLIMLHTYLLTGKPSVPTQELVRLTSHIIIWTSLITELINPILLKYVLKKNGDIS